MGQSCRIARGFSGQQCRIRAKTSHAVRKHPSQRTVAIVGEQTIKKSATASTWLKMFARIFRSSCLDVYFVARLNVECDHRNMNDSRRHPQLRTSSAARCELSLLTKVWQLAVSSLLSLSQSLAICCEFATYCVPRLLGECGM